MANGESKTPKDMFVEYLDQKIKDLTLLREAAKHETLQPGSWMDVARNGRSENGKREHRPNPFNDYVQAQVKKGRSRKQAIFSWRRRTKKEHV